MDLNVVSTYKVDGMYLQAYEAYYDEEITSSSAYVRAGYKKLAHIYATSRNTGKYVTGFSVEITATSSNLELLTVTVDNEKQVITFDASKAKVTEATTVKVLCTTSINDVGYNGTTFTVTIMPYSKPTASILTKWTDNKGLELDLKQYVTGDSSTYSVLKVDGKEYKFTANLDENSGRLTTSAGATLDSIKLDYDYNTDELGVFAVASGQWTGLDEVSDTTLICGDYESYDEEEADYIVSAYYYLSRAD